MVWKAGLAKREITTYEEGMVMLGWESAQQRIAGVIMPLHARALVLRAGRVAFAYVCTDLCLMTIAVRHAVLERLRGLGSEWGPHNVMLTATHTHSGPNGYSHHPIYHANTKGFSTAVFETIVEGIVASIAAADERCVPAVLRFGEAIISFEEPVAFNRSVAAYNRNPGVDRVPASRPELATSRRSLTLRIDRASDGRPLGIVNWFGVHGTSLRVENTYLHPDNKGIAAHLYETTMASSSERSHPFVAIFAQGAAGDVSPTSPVEPEPAQARSDLARAARNGAIQFRHARKAAEAALASAPLGEELRFETRNVDMAAVEVDPVFSGGRRHVRTSQGTIGLATAAGTAEGPGPLYPARSVLTGLSAITRAARGWLGARVDPKLPFLEVGAGTNGSFLGVLGIRGYMPLVGRHQHAVEFLRAADDAGLLGDGPWAPRVLPLQIVRLGRLLLCGVPGEPTTVAGAELGQSIERAAWQGAKGARPKVVVNGYANGYAGYVATQAEYELQNYEGASTLFGEWTLAGYQTMFDSMIRGGLGDDPSAPVDGPRLRVTSIDRLERQRSAGRREDRERQ